MFRFKRFTIRQDRAAMKVCTDACVLGAWAGVTSGTRLLDIGTGTGLLALMAAQRNPAAQIDAVELDEAAAGQARENVSGSPFASRIMVHELAIQAFAETASAPVYDHILTNPPFYVNSLRSPDRAVNRALHTDELSFTDLVTAVIRLLKPAATWSVLLPPPESDRLEKLALAAGLAPTRRLQLRHQSQKPVFRHLTTYQKSGDVPSPYPIEQLCIYELDGRTYTPDFRQLLAPFYLIF